MRQSLKKVLFQPLKIEDVEGSLKHPIHIASISHGQSGKHVQLVYYIDTGAFIVWVGDTRMFDTKRIDAAVEHYNLHAGLVL